MVKRQQKDVDKQIKQDILDLDDDVSDDKFKIPHSLIREIVKNGTEDIDGIVKKVYRCGCPEFSSCGFWKAFCEKHKDADLTDIQTRYDLANADFYEERSEKIVSE